MYKIAIIGPESTGKSTLAAQLAQHYSCSFIPEYSREYLAGLDQGYDIHDVVAIAQGQQRHIDAAIAQQPEYLISDTEAIVNKVWCEFVFGTTPQEIDTLVKRQDFDLYLLCDIDLEWTFDPLRENPDINDRRSILGLYLKALESINATYKIINGEGGIRLQKAIEAIEALTHPKKHLVFLARWYPNKYDPMFGLFVKRHAEAAALNDDVSVVYVHADSHIHKNYDIEQTTEQGVNTIRIYYKKSGKLSSAFRFWRACQKGLKVVGHVDLIHVHVLTRMGVVAWWQKIRHGTPYMITEHWSRYLPGNDFSGFLRKKTTKLVVRNASLVTTVTQNLAQAMQAHGLKNPHYVVLPNVVDTDRFNHRPHKNPMPKIIHISCFEDKSKNISGLLDALKALDDEGVAYQAVLIGNGIDYQAMRDRAMHLQLHDRVRFTGLMEGQPLADELASGDFLVLSSNYENMPVVIIEALACGLPVVSTKVGGIDEIVNPRNGLLVPPHDTNALKEALKKMCLSYSQYDGQQLREDIIKTNSNREVGRLLSQWYHKNL